jgi:hypothetical protein
MLDLIGKMRCAVCSTFKIPLDLMLEGFRRVLPGSIQVTALMSRRILEPY